MELRQYWNVIWRRKWLVLGIILLATLLSAVAALAAKRTYEAESIFITRQEPSPNFIPGQGNAEIFTFDRYYNWFGSEFLVDDYTQIVATDAFAGSVLQTMQQELKAGRPAVKKIDQLKEDIDKLKLMDIKTSINVDRRHRELRLIVTSSSKELTMAISDAAAIVLTDAKLKPLRGQMVDDKPVFSQMTGATVENAKSNASKEIINAALRAIMGIVLALALAFLLEYLDNSIRDEHDARRVLDMPVLGTIPKL